MVDALGRMRVPDPSRSISLSPAPAPPPTPDEGRLDTLLIDAAVLAIEVRELLSAVAVFQGAFARSGLGDAEEADNGSSIGLRLPKNLGEAIDDEDEELGRALVRCFDPSVVMRRPPNSSISSLVGRFTVVLARCRDVLRVKTVFIRLMMAELPELDR
jgi:hypothetical protein